MPTFPNSDTSTTTSSSVTVNLPTWVAFADLVKAFDTSNHQLMVMIIEKYDCPPNLCDTIARMYKYIVVKLVIGEFETTIEFKVGVKQGDSVAPVLFFFIVMAFSGRTMD